MSDDELYFSVGQAARELGEAPAKIRALCEAGLIEGARRTPGGQWRLPVESVERYKTEGLPTLPHLLPDSESGSSPNNSAPARRNPGKLLGEPSPGLIDSKEQVTRLEHKLEATRLRRQIAEEEDRIAEPVISAIKDIFKGQVQRQSELIDHRRKILDDLKRDQKRDQALEHARTRLRSLGFDSDPQIKLEVNQAVQKLLTSVEGMPASEVRALINAEVERIVTPLLRAREKQQVIEQQRKETEQAVTDAINSLPWDVRNGYNGTGAHFKQLAAQKVKAAVSGMPTSGLADKKAAALQAVQGIAPAHEHVREVDRVVTNLPYLYPVGVTSEERKDIEQAVRSTLMELPLGTTKRVMEQKRDELLAPFRERIGERQEREREQREAAQKRSEIESRVDRRLSRIDNHLRELDASKAIMLNFSERWDLAERLKKTIGPMMITEILQTPTMSDERIHQRIDALVDRVPEIKVAFELGHVERYLQGEYEFTGGDSEMLREAERLRGAIRPVLLKEATENPNMTRADIRRRIEQLIDKS